jgi:hypothetical protein
MMRLSINAACVIPSEARDLSTAILVTQVIERVECLCEIPRFARDDIVI